MIQREKERKAGQLVTGVVAKVWGDTKEIKISSFFFLSKNPFDRKSYFPSTSPTFAPSNLDKRCSVCGQVIRRAWWSTGKRDKLWGRQGEPVPCMIICPFISALHVSFTCLIHVSQWTPSPSWRLLFLITHLFVWKPPCFAEPVKVLICVLARLFGRWLLQGLRV